MLFERITAWLDALGSNDERGATAVEYAIMVAMIAVVIAGTVAALGIKVSEMFTPVTNAL
jgi:pilus assembly protein Flp/PilA